MFDGRNQEGKYRLILRGGEGTQTVNFPPLSTEYVDPSGKDDSEEGGRWGMEDQSLAWKRFLPNFCKWWTR